MRRRLAILIGNQSFEPDSGFAPLRGPHNDVDALASVLQDPARGDFELPVPPLKDATRTEMLGLIERTLGAATSDDTVLIHYSGHGKPDAMGNLYFAGKDTDAKLLATTGILASTVHDLARVSPCRAIVLLLDCCYAGAIGQAMNAGVKGDTSSLLQQQLRRTAQDAKGLFILTSSTAWQTSEEAEDERDGRVMGRFTRAVIECLTGMVPQSRDEILFSHLSAHVAAAFEGQDAREFRADSQGDPLLARVPPSETPEQRRERILTGWMLQGDISGFVYNYSFEALQGRGTARLAAMVRNLLDTEEPTPAAFTAAVEREARRKADEAATKLTEEKRAADVARKVEEKRKADEAAARLAEEKRAADEARQVEEKRKADEVAAWLAAEKKRETVQSAAQEFEQELELEGVQKNLAEIKPVAIAGVIIGLPAYMASLYIFDSRYLDTIAGIFASLFGTSWYFLLTPFIISFKRFPRRLRPRLALGFGAACFVLTFVVAGPISRALFEFLHGK